MVVDAVDSEASMTGVGHQGERGDSSSGKAPLLAAGGVMANWLSLVNNWQVGQNSSKNIYLNFKYDFTHLPLYIDAMRIFILTT